MGRSGTSAITRVLSLCGGALPKSLLPANHANPTGYWEPLDGLNLNEAFLARCGSNWYDPRLPLPIEATVDSPDGRMFVDQIAACLAGCADAPLLLIKEPRINALTEFWFAAVQRLGCQPAVVVAVRHPAEVAGSLLARDGMATELSNTLWFKYNWLAERRSLGLPRVFVEYSNLLADWRREVDRVAGALTIDLDVTKGAEIDAFLSPSLRHQRASNETAQGGVQTGIQQAHAMLSRASRDEPFSRDALESLVAAQMASPEARVAFDQFTKSFSPAQSSGTSSREKLAAI
jgi:hypothetical protein